MRRSRLVLLLLAMAPCWIGMASLGVQRDDFTLLLVPALLTALGALASHWVHCAVAKHDALLLPTVLWLNGLGLMTLARVAPNFLWRQTLWSALGVLTLVAIAVRGDVLYGLRRFKYTWLLAASALVIATWFFGVNPSGGSARLWLSVGDFFIQPSELLRLLLLAFLAASLSESHTATLSTTQALLVVGLALALLVVQQDLGAASLAVLLTAFMAYLATGRALIALAPLGALAALGGAAAALSTRVAQRLAAWLNPWADPQGSTFQTVQSLIAVASGGLLGKGIGQGSPTYVPAVHTDFIFVALAEELGALGALAALAGYAVIVLRAWRIARAALERYTALLSGGIAAAFATQITVIVGGNLALLPLTGVTLPLMSYGGSSLLVSYTMLGLLIRLSAMPPAPLAAFQAPAILQHTARRASRLSAAMFALLALGLGYWSIVQRDALYARSDNPRLIDAERAIFRGAILDQRGALLAYSTCVTAARPLTPCATAPPRYLRHYTDPAVAPVVGYYSLRYGVGGLEAFADARLRGQRTWIESLLHRPQVGAPLTSTLDLRMQRELWLQLKGQPGAAVAMDWRTGAVLALVSAPAFDPNRLDADWEQLRRAPDAPLLNRATQGLYQPGALLRWMLAQHALLHPGAGDALARMRALELDQPVAFELPNQAVPLPVTLTYSETIGQGQLRLSPLRVATSLAALTRGQPIRPTLLLEATSEPALQPPRLVGKFEGEALIAADRRAAWHVRVDAQVVMVRVVEIN
ncbi:MAG: FtsW/RodA/SpoVE family cell cycle protein [Anaerolineae bacterium]|nr:FtsW/RodA/SpoVE family cell cycle protein [Thermoflexales bacterium]MDW8292952.1 FtsW/RodA/SpoVE family cell cycle protein [Anaerolineae bacterium]